MMRFRGVFFDLDGTLLDTTPLILKSFQYTFRKHYQRDVSLADIQPFMGKPLRDAMEIMAPGEEDAVIATYREFNLRHHDELAGIFTGVHDTVKRLYDAGAILAVVTSKSSVTARRGLRLFNLEQYFSAVIGVDETLRHKPEPEPVLAALQATKLLPEECIMIGDSPHDIMSGRSAGLKTAAVAWSSVSLPELQASEPDYNLRQMSDLLTIVLDNQ